MTATDRVPLSGLLARALIAYARTFELEEDASFVAAIRASTNGGYALIGDALKARLSGNARLRLEPGKAGRRPTAATTLDALTLELGL